MHFDNLELPCIFVPEGGKLPEIPWGDPAMFPAIFIPDGYQGPRPGYPWIEFGRMTLQVPKARRPREAASAATAAGTRQSMASVSDVEPRAVAPDQLAGGSFAPIGRNSDETRRATNVYPDLGATVRSWTSPSDLRAMTSALDALSPSSPFVASAAPGVGGGSSGEGITRGSPAPRGGNSNGVRLATSAYADLGATVRIWNSLSDLRATTAALALSPALDVAVYTQDALLRATDPRSTISDLAGITVSPQPVASGSGNGEPNYQVTGSGITGHIPDSYQVAGAGSYTPGGANSVPIPGVDPLDPTGLNKLPPSTQEQIDIANTYTAISNGKTSGLNPHPYVNAPSPATGAVLPPSPSGYTTYDVFGSNFSGESGRGELD